MKKVLLGLMLIVSMVVLGGCGDDSSSTESSKNTALQYNTVAIEEKANKAVYVVIVKDAPVTEEQLVGIGNKLIDESKGKNVFVNFTDTDIEGIPYTYGKVENVNGNTKEHFTLNKEWDKKPVEDDYKKYVLYNKFLLANPSGTYEDFVNSYQDKPSAEDIKNSVEKVENWLLSGK